MGSPSMASGFPKVALNFAGTDELLNAWAQHLAEGGLWVDSPPPPRATEVELSLITPHVELAGLKAQVVSRPPRETGPGFWLEVQPSAELLAYVERTAREQRQGRHSPI